MEGFREGGGWWKLLIPIPVVLESMSRDPSSRSHSLGSSRFWGFFFRESLENREHLDLPVTGDPPGPWDPPD